MTGVYRQGANFALAAQLVRRSIAYAMAGAGYADHRHLDVRQVSPATTTSINWWPYPSWGASTTDAGAPPPTSPVVNAPASSATSLLATMTTLSALLSSSAPSSTASDSLIHITALPPATTSASKQLHHTVKPATPFNIAYLAPLFAVLGAAAGALVAWCVWRWFSRREKRARCESGFLEPGPRYIAPPETGSEGQDAQSVNRDVASERPSRVSARADGTSNGSWLTRAFSGSVARANPADASGPAGGRPEASPQYTAVADDDPFVDRQPSERNSASFDASRVNRQSTARRPTSAHNSDSWDHMSDADDDEPYETVRHKSIRRGILERLKFGTMRRPPSPEKKSSGLEMQEGGSGIVRQPAVRRGNRFAHTRRDSDFTLDAIRQPPQAHSHTSTPTRSRSSARGGDDDSVSVITTPGFRIVEEDTEADEIAAWKAIPSSRTASNVSWEKSSLVKGGFASNWSTPRSSPTKYVATDKFTALPPRRTVEEKRTSPFSTPGASRTTTLVASTSKLQMSTSKLQSSPSKYPLTRVDSSVLPISPTRITYPPLESQLFFSAIGTDFGSTPSLNLSMPGDISRVASNRSSEAIASPSPKPRNKLRTQREPPPLPFPSTASNSPYRNRLKKLTSRGTPTPTPTPPVADRYRIPSPPVSPSPSRAGPGGSLPTDGLLARHSALDKVDEIISRSWDQRNMSNESLTASPTRGAGGGNGGTANSSIHQRLASLMN